MHNKFPIFNVPIESRSKTHNKPSLKYVIQKLFPLILINKLPHLLALDVTCFFFNSLKQEKQLTLIMLLDQSKVNKIKLYRLLNTTSKSYKKVGV